MNNTRVLRRLRDRYRRPITRLRHAAILGTHLTVLLVIVYSLYTEGGKTADWSFLALSVLAELHR